MSCKSLNRDPATIQPQSPRSFIRVVVWPSCWDCRSALERDCVISENQTMSGVALAVVSPTGSVPRGPSGHLLSDCSNRRTATGKRQPDCRGSCRVGPQHSSATDPCSPVIPASHTSALNRAAPARDIFWVFPSRGPRTADNSRGLCPEQAP